MAGERVSQRGNQFNQDSMTFCEGGNFSGQYCLIPPRGTLDQSPPIQNQKEENEVLRFLDAIGQAGKSKNEAPIKPAKEADSIPEMREIIAGEGETYWSIATSLVVERMGRSATAGEVKRMFQLLAYFNNKTEIEAAKIRPGQKVKLPPPNYPKAQA